MKAVEYSKKQNPFWVELNMRVDAYFKDHKIKKTGDIRLHIKSAVFIPLAVTLYIILVFFTPPTWIAILLCVLLGASIAFIGFNVMHDASHKCYSKKKWLNSIMLHTADLMGASSVMWVIKHSILHHGLTNSPDDTDLDLAPFIRTRKSDKRRFFHKYQHIYGPVVYCFLYVLWIFGSDTVKYFKGKIGKKKLRFSMKDHLVFWASKAWHIILFILLPIYYVGPEALWGYVILSAVTGFTLSMTFQLAHLVETSTFPEGKIEISWSESQIQETSDFATDNKVLSWFLGGLNFQVIHHLFQGISHVHYVDIQKIFKKTCAEYKIKYNELSFFGAIFSHIRTLKKLGRQEQSFA